MSFRLKTGPASEPISRDDIAKLHLKVDASADDALIDIWIQAAREQVENYTGISLMPQTWECKLKAFPDEDYIELRHPVLAVSGVTYQDANDEVQTMPSGDYILDTASVPNRICLANGASYPSALYEEGSITIEFVSGYPDASGVPAAIKSAMLLIIAHLYEHREDVVVGRIVTEMNMGSKYLLAPYRISP